MKPLLSPYNNIEADLLFWLKEFISKKISTLSTRTSTSDEALRITQIRKVIKQPNTTLREIDELTKETSRLNFKGLRNYAYPVIDFIRFCTNERKLESIQEISTAILQEDYIASKHYSCNVTKTNHYRAISNFLKYIQNNHSIDASGAGYQFGIEALPRSFKSKKIPETLYPSEFEKFVKFIDSKYTVKDTAETQRNRLMVKLICYGGLRVSEVVSLTKRSFGTPYRDDVDNELYYPLKVTGKGDKERMIHLKITKKNGELLGELTPWLDGVTKDSDRLFSIGAGRVHQIVQDALNQCGIKKAKKGPHMLRHSYATYLHHKGKSLGVIQKLLGHEDISTTTIYAKVIDTEVMDAAKVF